MGCFLSNWTKMIVEIIMGLAVGLGFTLVIISILIGCLCHRRNAQQPTLAGEWWWLNIELSLFAQRVILVREFCDPGKPRKNSDTKVPTESHVWTAFWTSHKRTFISAVNSGNQQNVECSNTAYPKKPPYPSQRANQRQEASGYMYMEDNGMWDKWKEWYMTDECRDTA